MERMETHRLFFAKLIAANAGAPKGHERLVTAFATTPRERFAGPGPWKVFTATGYIETPTEDPAFLYQDVVVAIAPERRINIGQPVLHAICLAALNLREGESVVHIGGGAGYDTALHATLTGAGGSAVSRSVARQFGERRTRNL